MGRRICIQAAIVCSGVLLFAGCGGDDDDGGAPAGAGAKPGLSLERVEMAADNGDFMNSVAWMTADQKYWPELGFGKPAEVVASDSYMSGLIGGDVWVAQGESDAIWAATAEGSVDLKIVGVEKDSEPWVLGVREGVDAENLEGLKISGGPPGERNVEVGRHALRDMGVDPDKLEWVTVNGGPEDRLRVLVAGQIDVAVLQSDLRPQLEQAGGKLIYNEQQASPQEVWVVTADTLAKNKDAVCAYVQGRIAAKQWLSEGEDYKANLDAAVKLAGGYGVEPTEGDLSEWAGMMDPSWALDGGSSVESFDRWTADMIAIEQVPAEYDWRDHVDFSCLWEAQEALGLELNPVRSEVGG